MRDAEKAGFDVAWLPDLQFLWRDVWSALALAATQTSSTALGTCVTNLETRHPSVTAAAAASVEELAPGRVLLGIGSGDSAVKTLGLEPTSLTRMREQVGVLRTLLAGEAADFDGRSLAVKAAGRTLPLYLAATGPKMQALAGELADGVIVVTGLEPDLVRATLARIGAGAASGGRNVDELDVRFGTYAHVTSDRREAARIVKLQSSRRPRPEGRRSCAESASRSSRCSSSAGSIPICRTRKTGTPPRRLPPSG